MGPEFEYVIVSQRGVRGEYRKLIVRGAQPTCDVEPNFGAPATWHVPGRGQSRCERYAPCRCETGLTLGARGGASGV